jgi:hypothetical protein
MAVPNAHSRKPPLSWNLKDLPAMLPNTGSPGYLFGETGAQIINRAIVCFPEFSSPLRSFCLRVSGAVAPSAPFPIIRVRYRMGAARGGPGRSLPQGIV